MHTPVKEDTKATMSGHISAQKWISIIGAINTR